MTLYQSQEGICQTWTRGCQTVQAVEIKVGGWAVWVHTL